MPAPAVPGQRPGNGHARTATISARLYGLVFASVLSGVLCSAALIAYDFQQSRERLVGEAQARTRAVASAVDAELSRLQSGLGVLATSPSIAAGDFRALHGQVSQIMRMLRTDNIVVRESSGQQIVNANVAFGQALPPGTNGPLFDPVFQTGQPMVTDLYHSARTGGHLVSVAVPVPALRGQTAYAITASMTPRSLLQVLEQSRLPDNWLAALFDSTGTTIARTREMDRFMGKKAGPQLLPLMLANTEGMLDGVTRDGSDSLTVFRRIGAAGWTVTVSIPKEQLTAGLWDAVWVACAVAALILLVGSLLAWFIGMRIVRTIRQLGGHAHMLETGGTMALQPLYFREADELGQAFTTAAQALLEADSAVSAVNAELEQVNARLQSFAYSLAHDLRQPLVSAGGFGSLLDKRLELAGDATGRHYLQRLVASMRQVDAITDALLELARISRASFRPRLVDASAMATDTLRRLRESDPQRQVETSVAPGMKIFGDSDLLGIVFDHLIGNAWKFTMYHVPGAISVGAGTAPGGEPMWWLKDNGAGFDMQYANKLFQPFQRLHDNAGFPGLGTGLANVRAAISRHGGKIWAESSPGEGAAFYFTIPD